MIKNFLKKIKHAFCNLDKKILKVLKYGLIFSFLILLISIFILTINLTTVHNIIIYEIGILIFEISLYFAADFVISALAIDVINKQI